MKAVNSSIFLFFIGLLSVSGIAFSYGQCPVLTPSFLSQSVCKGGMTYLKVGVNGTDSAEQWLVLDGASWVVLGSGSVYSNVGADSLSVNTAGGVLPALSQYRFVSIPSVLSGCPNDTSVSISLQIDSLVSRLSAKHTVLCAGMADTLWASFISDAGDPSGPFSYHWSVAGQVSVTGDTNVVTPLASGTNMLWLVTVTDVNGCSAVDSGRFSVNSNNNLSASLSVDKGLHCAGTSDTLVAGITDSGDPTGPFSYAWAAPGIVSASGDTNVITPLTGFTNKLWLLTITDTYGCSVVDSTRFSVNANSNFMNVSLFTGNGMHCAGTADTLVALFKDMGDSTGPFTLSWNIQGKISANRDTNIFIAGVPSKNNLGMVTITDKFGCSVVDSARFTVNGISNSSIIVSPTTIFVDFPETLSTKVTGDIGDSAGPFRYLWNVSNPNTPDTLATSVYTPNKTGTNLVWKVLITDSNKCSVTDSGFFNVSIPVASDNGEWIPQISNISSIHQSIFSMSATSANTVWASVYDTTGDNYVNAYVHTTNGGATWTPGLVSGAPGLMINCITAIGNDSAWVSMIDTTPHVGGGAIYATTNGGLSWIHQSGAKFSGPWGYPDFVYFFDRNNGICVGDSNERYWEIYTTSNAGNDWIRVDSLNIPRNLPNEEGVDNTFAASGDTVWFCTTAGRVFVSTDTGRSWQAHSSNLNDVPCGIAFTDPMTGIASDGTSIVATSDGGVTWVNQPYTGKIYDGWLCSIPGTSGNYMFTGLGKNNSGSSLSIDGGKTWHQIDTLDHGAVAFYNVFSGWSGGMTTSPINGMFTWSNPLGIPEFTSRDHSILVFPNPMSERATVRILSSSKKSARVSLLLYDALGNLVSSQLNQNTMQFEIQRASLARGLYYYKVVSEEGSLGAGKIVVE